jgi:hypothetical protein
MREQLVAELARALQDLAADIGAFEEPLERLALLRLVLVPSRTR